ncbi:hypothetical protein H310_10533 [Aphanomyces invadans]|uniref:Uncharacterized protein n=1 Tax=Aphanomyces invadans TaxID=157072 RepID=A0A024TQH3_9STRA|nr:hypothetical protein H310_10533 [Aphanomyces invadans]ETV96380.1 hypothetical protein H310_10533 [Aphanomyces invadans]|eukprot:XP_008875172.1 hypothetical protein H310_10533 [Aphanomyces invadans]
MGFLGVLRAHDTPALRWTNAGDLSRLRAPTPPKTACGNTSSDISACFDGTRKHARTTRAERSRAQTSCMAPYKWDGVLHAVVHGVVRWYANVGWHVEREKSPQLDVDNVIHPVPLNAQQPRDDGGRPIQVHAVHVRPFVQAKMVLGAGREQQRRATPRVLQVLVLGAHVAETDRHRAQRHRHQLQEPSRLADVHRAGIAYELEIDVEHGAFAIHRHDVRDGAHKGEHGDGGGRQPPAGTGIHCRVLLREDGHDVADHDDKPRNFPGRQEDLVPFHLGRLECTHEAERPILPQLDRGSAEEGKRHDASHKQERPPRPHNTGDPIHHEDVARFDATHACHDGHRREDRHKREDGCNVDAHGARVQRDVLWDVERIRHRVGSGTGRTKQHERSFVSLERHDFPLPQRPLDGKLPCKQVKCRRAGVEDRTQQDVPGRVKLHQRRIRETDIPAGHCREVDEFRGRTWRQEHLDEMRRPSEKVGAVGGRRCRHTTARCRHVEVLLGRWPVGGHRGHNARHARRHDHLRAGRTPPIRPKRQHLRRRRDHELITQDVACQARDADPLGRAWGHVPRQLEVLECLLRAVVLREDGSHRACRDFVIVAHRRRARNVARVDRTKRPEHHLQRREGRTEWLVEDARAGHDRLDRRVLVCKRWRVRDERAVGHRQPELVDDMDFVRQWPVQLERRLRRGVHRRLGSLQRHGKPRAHRVFDRKRFHEPNLFEVLKLRRIVVDAMRPPHAGFCRHGRRCRCRERREPRLSPLRRLDRVSKHDGEPVARVDVGKVDVAQRRLQVHGAVRHVPIGAPTPTARRVRELQVPAKVGPAMDRHDFVDHALVHEA